MPQLLAALRSHVGHLEQHLQDYEGTQEQMQTTLCTCETTVHTVRRTVGRGAVAGSQARQLLKLIDDPMKVPAEPQLRAI